MAVEEKKEDYKGHRQRCEKIKKAHETQESNSRRYNSGFPPNVTVDELWIYRKKDQDVLTVRPLKPRVSLKLEGLHEYQSEYNESFIEHPMQNFPQSSNCLQIMDNDISTSQLSELETTSQINNHIVRPRLLKRPTNLKIEGDFLHVTEHAEKFIEYLLEKRAELLRTPTTLRLEGEMDTMTETREQFIKYDKVGRPPLCKKFSNLHLEGKREIVTEKQDKFMPFEVTKRPPLRKKSTNLNLEGDLNLIPEYRRQYIDYKSLERPKLVLPTNNLKIGGLFESISGELNPNDKQRHPLIPFLRESDKRLDDVIDHRKIPTRASYSGESEQNYNRNKTYLNINSGKSGSHPNLNYMKRNISLERNMEMNPEYKNSYIDFYKHGRISPKVKSKRQSELNYMHGDSKMEIQPESSRSYINFPRQRPYVRKPEGHISNEGEVYYLTEKNEKFVPHTLIEKSEPCSREPELKVEGRFQCQPEYRRAYIDYLIRERQPTETQKRRAFELISQENEMLDHTFQNIISDSELTTTNEKEIPTNQEFENSQSNLNIPTVTKDSSSCTSSIVSSPKPSRKTSRLRKLSQIEASAFGPRCTPRVQGSLTPSPIPRPGRDNEYKVRSRDSSPTIITENTRVPCRRSNLSETPTIAEVPLLQSNRWSESADSDTAFLVLDEKVPNKRVATNNLYKEQKWMPSWNYPNK